MLSFFASITSCLRTSNIIGLSTELDTLIQSLLGSNCARIAFTFSLSPVRISGCSCSNEMVSLAVVDKSAGRAAEYVYEAEEMR